MEYYRKVERKVKWQNFSNRMKTKFLYTILHDLCDNGMTSLLEEFVRIRTKKTKNNYISLHLGKHPGDAVTYEHKIFSILTATKVKWQIEVINWQD